MQVTVLYVGSSVLAPLKNAERDINCEYKLNLRVATHNFGAPLSDKEWTTIRSDLEMSEVVFVIHVMDSENAARLIPLLAELRERIRAVIVINCMPELMRCVRMGKLNVGRLIGNKAARDSTGDAETRKGFQLLSSVGSWIGKQVRGAKRSDNHGQYLKLVDKLPGVLRFVPNTGALRDVKNYLQLFCYFLQPTPLNIRSMVLFSLQRYVRDERLASKRIKVSPPESAPTVAVYHPDADKLFETLGAYEKWCRGRKDLLDPDSTVGLLLMRPQVISNTTRHYDTLIRELEAEGLSVIPAISTLMDNREACTKFFTVELRPRVSQIISLTGFSFVGGPAMNDSAAANQFLTTLNRPYRSVVSLDMQTIDSWRDSFLGLNPVQAGMQIAIPEVDGATEPFVYGGIPIRGIEPIALEDRCRRFARRVKRWNRLRTAKRSELKIALTLFCFPPNKGNIGTAADLDVFPSLYDTLKRLKADGYSVEVPTSINELQDRLLEGNSARFGATANVAYLMGADEYSRACPYVNEIENEWGPPPGRINSFGDQLLIQGLQLGNVFIGIQPTFGFEGDPTRLMMARGSSPHHGFMAFYLYLSKILNVDAVVHVGTHGALEFMPGKQLGLSGECWPDRLVGELPNIYLYSVNNPSEGSIAKRRSYAELISYLTPPMENAGLYKGLASLKELVDAYRTSTDEAEKTRLFAEIEQASCKLNLTNSAIAGEILRGSPDGERPRCR